MDMQYQYTEKYVKDIAEAIRFVAGTDDTYSIKEMPAAIAASNPPMLGKPEDLFGTQFNAQLGTANQVFRWAIFSKYPDDSYLVAMDGLNSNLSTAAINRGMLFNSDFTQFVPYYKFEIGQYYPEHLYFTRQRANDACGTYLDSDGYPHIPKDLPFIMPAKSFTGFNSNQGRYYPSFPNTGRYNESTASDYAYLSSGDIRANPIFKNRFKAFGVSNLNGLIPNDLYSILSDGKWHTGSEMSSNLKVKDFVDTSSAPNTIRYAHFWNRLGYSDDNLGFYGKQGWGGHCGPSVMYLVDPGDKWRYNTSTKTIYCDNYGDRVKAYYQVWGDINRNVYVDPIVENAHGVYPFSDGIGKISVPFIDYTDCGPAYIAFSAYDPPRTTEELKSYFPFRTYDILDQNGNVLLPANATLADFGIT